MLSSLATEIPDPVGRLRAISAAMSQAKHQESLIDAEVLTDWTEFTFPVLIGGVARLISSTRLFDRVRPGVQRHDLEHPGTPVSMFLAGARVTVRIR